MRREKSRAIITACSIAVAGVVFASNAQADCSRKNLQKLTDTYVKAQTAGNTKALRFAKGASYAENDKPMDVGAGVLAGPLKIDFTA